MENVNIAQVNYVLAALGTRPFAEVKDLIEDIKKQGDAQIPVAQPAEAA